MPQRPLLTAAWRNLLLLNFPVPTEIIQRLAPPGTEPDLHDGQSYISIVGFQFENVRLFGLPIPGHTNFPEINLRYYVRRTVGPEVRRGVVFAREIVPRRAVAILANHLYNENYVTRPMRSEHQVAGALALPTPGSLDEFIVEHYWGYTHGRDGKTREYQVAHVPWRIAPAKHVIWNCEVAANYDSPLAEFLTAPPTSAIIAEGSPIQVFRGHCC